MRSFAVGGAGLLLLASAYLVFDRGGALAWLGGLLGAALLLKVLRWPAPRDAILCGATLLLWIFAWGATWSYVRSTWESGEVVEIEAGGSHSARVWVMDTTEGPVMYYDAPPDAARALLAGGSLTMVRDGRVQKGCADAERVEDLPAKRVEALLDRMQEKYGDRNTATDVFYVVLGVERDRVGLVIELASCPAPGQAQ